MQLGCWDFRNSKVSHPVKNGDFWNSQTVTAVFLNKVWTIFSCHAEFLLTENGSVSRYVCTVVTALLLQLIISSARAIIPFDISNFSYLEVKVTFNLDLIWLYGLNVVVIVNINFIFIIITILHLILFLFILVIIPLFGAIYVSGIVIDQPANLENYSGPIADSGRAGRITISNR